MTALAYCTVVGKFADLTPDAADGDTHPDAGALTGQVTLTCDARDLPGGSTPLLLLPTETPPRTITIEPFPVALDNTGAFSIEVPGSGQTGVTVPPVFTYTASFDLKNAFGAKVKISPFSFYAPAGQTVDLASVPRAATDNGTRSITPPGSGGGSGIVDNGDGTFTSSGTALVDNGDGTFTSSGSSVVDNGDGTFLAA